jgi:hypothetical protein
MSAEPGTLRERLMSMSVSDACVYTSVIRHAADMRHVEPKKWLNRALAYIETWSARYKGGPDTDGWVGVALAVAWMNLTEEQRTAIDAGGAWPKRQPLF